tara:strand:- start:485 stop:1324 length:840 start_codon:yes stop_codon:yes gene_type:complete
LGPAIFEDVVSGGTFEEGELLLEAKASSVKAGGRKAGRLRKGGGGEVAETVADAVQCRGHPVILALRDGVELVVVTASTMDGESQEGLAHDTDDVFQFVLADNPLHGLALLRIPDLVVGSGNQEAGGDDRSGVTGVEHVTGQLPGDKSVVGHVGIEGAGDPVPIPPGVGPDLVSLEALAFSVSNNIQPVASPSLSVMGMRQQAVDQPDPCPRPRVVDKLVDGGRVRRESEEVETEPACESSPRGGGRCGQPGGAQAGGYKRVDRVCVRRRGGVDRRRSR